MGLDIGDARTGVARSDALQMIAFPYKVVHAATETEMLRNVAALIKELEPILVVAGLPLSQDGVDGPRAEKTKDILEKLREMINVDIITEDERFTTAQALRVARDMKASRRSQKGKVDQIAASLILQSFLDRRRAQGAAQPAQE